MFRPIRLLFAVLALGAPLALGALPTAAQAASQDVAAQSSSRHTAHRAATRHRAHRVTPVRRHHATHRRTAASAVAE